MPSDLVAALAAPIREVQSMVGPGWSGDPALDPSTAFGGVRDALADAAAREARAAEQLHDSVSAACTTAHASATAYDDVDQRVGGQIAGL